MAKFDFSDLNVEPAQKKKLDFSDLNRESSAANEGEFGTIPHAIKLAAQDAGHLALQIPSAAAHGILNLPKDVRYLSNEIPNVAHQLANDPKHASRVAIAGLADLGHSTLNTPSAIGNYMAKIGLISPQSASQIPRQHDISPELSQFVGAPQAGDELIRGTLRNSPLIMGTGGIALKGLQSIGNAAAYPIRKAAEAVSDVKNVRNLSKAESDLEQMEEAKNTATRRASDAENLEGQAQSAAAVDPAVGSKDIDTLSRKINSHKEELNDINNKISAIPEITDKAPEVVPNSSETFAHLNQATEAHGQAKKLSQDIENQISEHLNKGASHDVRAAARIDEIQSARHKEISKGYDQFEKDIADKNVTLSNPRNAKDILGEINELVKAGKDQSIEAKELADELYNLKSKETIPAKDYLTAYRSARDYAREARTKAFTPGMNAEERAQWEQKYNALDDKVEEMGKNLEEGIGEENVATLNKLNARWKNEVVPLYRNSIYQNIKFNGKMPDNIIKSLRGTDKGNVLIRNIIKNDPELLKNVVGQRYADKPSALHKAGELYQEYIDNMPELKSALENHRNVNQTIDKVSQVEKESAQKHKQTLFDEKQAQKEAENIEKDRQKNQGLKDKLNVQKEKLQSDIAAIEKHVANLRRLADEKKLSLAEKAKREQEYKQQKQLLKEKKESQARLYKKVRVLGAGVVGYYGGKSVLNNFTK